jgi:hypothetical protein
MDSLKLYPGLPYPTLQRPAGGLQIKHQPATAFYPFGHLTLYAYDILDNEFGLKMNTL